VPIIVKMAFKSESDGKKKLFFEYWTGDLLMCQIS
jgi:hypothetical protein